MKFSIPEDVNYIIDKIYKKGFEAFIVGGCVRDLILNIKPNDYDITTSAKPSEIKDIFKEYKILENGEKHGTIGVIINNEVYEITTYRIEGEYNDNRRPSNVEFTNNLKKDLERRDFTINSMAYNDNVGIVDLFGGKDDINKRLIKTVGNADERFKEDGLRMIRAIRFSSKLGFDIDEDVLNAIKLNSKLIKNISIERITDEISKILISNNPENMSLLIKTNILNELGINDYKAEFTKEEKQTLKEVSDNLESRICIYDYINNKDNNKSLIDILRYSNKVISTVTLIENLMREDDGNLSYIDFKVLLSKIDKDIIKKYIDIKMIYYYNLNQSHEIEKISNYNRYITDIEKNKECYKIRDLDINGNDIKNLGYQGEKIGVILDKLLKEVIIYPKLNEKSKLIKLISDSQIQLES